MLATEVFRQTCAYGPPVRRRNPLKWCGVTTFNYYDAAGWQKFHPGLIQSPGARVWQGYHKLGDRSGGALDPTVLTRLKQALADRYVIER